MPSGRRQQCEAERKRILHDLATVEPRLRAGATAEIDTRAPLDEVVDALERIAESIASRSTTGARLEIGAGVDQCPRHLGVAVAPR
jgi:hypothetical protein